MVRMIFVNLPVADLPRATAFYEALGGRKDERFSGATESCLVLSETISLMLLTRDRFGTFTPRPVADARAATEVLLCLSEESRAGVDARVAAADAAGGRADPAPKQDHGFMYGRSVEDPDGHILEFAWMDLAAFEAAKAGAAPASAA